jgi:branched-chain amino acid transport system ATP-binding protein
MARNAGEVSAPLVVGGLIVAWGWRATYVVWGIPLILIGIVILLRLKEPVRGYMERRASGADETVAEREDEPQSFAEGWRTAWSVRTVRRAFMAEIWTFAGDTVFAVLLPFYLAERYGLNALERGLVFIPSLALGIFASYIGGGLVDYFTRRQAGRVLVLIGLFEVIAAIGFAVASVEPPIVLVAAAISVGFFGRAFSGPAYKVVYAQVLPPSIRTQGLQITRLAEIPATILFLNISGVLASEYGYTTALLFCTPLFLIGAAIIASAGAFFDLDMRNASSAALAAEEWRRAKAEGRGKMLVCRDVDVEYDGVQVLFGVDFDVEEGEIVALLGTNGAGKSTLLRAIAGSQEASGGAIVFDGRDITHMPSNEIASRGIITMPGGRGVFPGLTVRENLALGSWMNDDEAEVRARLEEIFEIFPVLRERAATPASALSGGEQQMLSLAQAFLAKPRVLMIDELSLGLSPAVVGQLLDIVREIHSRGTTIIVVEQSVNVALTIAERAIFMEKGEVRFFGATADLLGRPDILRAVYVKGTGALTSGAPASALRTERERRALDLGEARFILELDELVKRYGGVTAVDRVSIDLREGEVLGLIGPNGSGKTTLFDLVSGYQRADAGVVRYDGVDVTDLGPEERARRGLIRRFQDARLFSSLSVTETLLVALEQRLEVKSTAMSAFSFPAARRAERRARQRAERLIELLELGSYRDKFVKELSTGLRRIVDLACVLAAEPRVLLLDEPSSGIAQAEAESLGPLLRRIRYETGCSILIIEHDMPLISTVSDELVALELGQVLVRGRPDEVLNDERVIESYLGTTEEAVRRSGSLT